MPKYFYKKFQRTKLGFDNLRSKVIVKVWNLATRMDLGRGRKGEKKK